MSKKTYTITLEYRDGHAHIERLNEGFSALELIGTLEHIKNDLLQRTLNSSVDPDQKPLPDLGKGFDAKD